MSWVDQQGDQNIGGGGGHVQEGGSVYVPPLPAPPGWYLTDPSAVAILPRSWRWESPDVAIERTNIMYETIRGARSGHRLFSRRTPAYIFRVPYSELLSYQALTEAVGGNFQDFYWVPDTADMTTFLHVRMVQAHFKPVKLGGFYWTAGVVERTFDFTLELSEEVEPVDIS